MATIDTSGIEGFEAMSDADKVAALLKVSIPDKVDLSQYVSKQVFDKAASDLASVKKQLNERMNDDERAKADADTKMQDLQTKYDALLRESTISKYKAEYLAQGYSDELAGKVAQYSADGDWQKVFEANKKFLEEHDKAIKAELLKGTPRPGGHNGESEDESAEDKAVTMAKQIAQNRAKLDGQTNDILKHYKIGG